MRALELKIPPPVVIFVLAGLMWVVASARPLFGFVFPARVVLAIALVAIGFATGLSGVITFRLARTTVNPLNPERSSSLVTRGIYSVTRNPMYLGGLLMLTAWAVFLSNALPFLFLPVYILYINRFQIVPEERALAVLFPKAFVEYKTRVRRWL